MELTHQNGFDLFKTQKSSTHYTLGAKLSRAMISLPHKLLLRPVLERRVAVSF